MRLHITGASGSGTTTLGRALAQRLAAPHFDSDDFFWRPTDPPYREKLSAPDRQRLLGELLGERRTWVLSGSLDGWGDQLAALFDLVVWLDVPTEIRVARLAARERVRYGRTAVAPGGAQYGECRAFLAWAASYESPLNEGRSRHRHAAWLAGLPCPVLKLAGNQPTRALVRAVLTGVA